MTEPRSGCPINMSVELLGDRWSLVVLRDIVFGGKRHFTDLLRRSEEGITPATLTARLDRMEQGGLITRAPDPAHRQRTIISLPDRGIDLVPVLVALSTWGLTHLPVAGRFAARARLIKDGGQDLLTRLMADLRHEHLGAPPPARSARPDLAAAAPPQALRTGRQSLT